MQKSIKKRLHKFLSIAIALIFIIGLLPQMTLPAAAVTCGDFEVTGDATGYTYASSVLTFTGDGTYTVAMASGVTQTTDKIVVNRGTETDPINITLSGVIIKQSTGCAFQIKNSSVVNLTLAEGTTNTLKSGWTSGNIYSGHAGLQISEGATITIDGDGTLNATGSSFYAGIGGNYQGISGTIIINGGIVKATGGSHAAGIGGSDHGSNGTIIINGGIVKATGGDYAAGIGGGGYADGGTVIITGGTVTAKSTKFGAGIGAGDGGSKGNLTITGGSVYLSGSSSDTPTPTNGSDTVYLTAVSLEGIETETAVSSLTTNLSYTYGTNDVNTDSDGKLYLWLPANTETTAVETAEAGFSGSIITGSSNSSTTVTLPKTSDYVNPTVSSVTPSGDNNTLSGDIIITFSEEMSTTAGTVSLDNGTTTKSLTGGSWSNNNQTYTVSYSDLSLGTTYTVSISDFEDCFNNVMANDTANNFTTTADGEKPTVSSVTPSGDTAPLIGDIIITFSEEMSTTAGTVSLDDGTTTTTLSGGSWSNNNQTYTVSFSGLSEATSYTISIFDFEDCVNNVMDADSGHSFKTRIDLTKPTVGSVTPDGDNNMLSGEIEITFSEEMDTTVGAVSLDSGTTALTGGSWSNNNQTYTVSYLGLSIGTTYTVLISGFKDISDNTMDTDSTHSFKTIASCGNGTYFYQSDSDSAYKESYMDDNLLNLTVNSGVSGFTYFGVDITSVNGHAGDEICLFVHMRNGAQLCMNATKADFETVGSAYAAFNVKPGDVIMVYIVDELTNGASENPNVL